MCIWCARRLYTLQPTHAFTLSRACVRQDGMAVSCPFLAPALVGCAGSLCCGQPAALDLLPLSIPLTYRASASACCCLSAAPAPCRARDTRTQCKAPCVMTRSLARWQCAKTSRCSLPTFRPPWCHASLISRCCAARALARWSAVLQALGWSGMRMSAPMLISAHHDAAV